jgi:signal transduction histidine kinase
MVSNSAMKLTSKTQYLTPLIIGLSAVPILFTGNVYLSLVLILLSYATFSQIRALLLNVQTKSNPNDYNSLDESRRPRIFSSIDELASGIAHEINNPLAIITQEAVWIQRLLKGLTIETGGAKAIEDCLDSSIEIQRQVDRCNLIVQKLLSMARELNVVIQQIDINEITKSVYDIVIRESSASNIRVNLSLDPYAPSILSDAPLLRQVLLNIVMNAIQAIGANGEINLRTKSQNKSWVDIEIQDDGCGICEENLEKIFLPFFSTKQETQGTGLGLAICRGIVEKLGGYITVTSKPNLGTIFTVRLPLTSNA